MGDYNLIIDLVISWNTLIVVVIIHTISYFRLCLTAGWMTQLCGHSKAFQFVMQSLLDGYWQRKTYALKIQCCHIFSGSVCNLLVWYTSVLEFQCHIFLVLLLLTNFILYRKIWRPFLHMFGGWFGRRGTKDVWKWTCIFVADAFPFENIYTMKYSCISL